MAKAGWKITINKLMIIMVQRVMIVVIVTVLSHLYWGWVSLSDNLVPGSNSYSNPQQQITLIIINDDNNDMILMLRVIMMIMMMVMMMMMMIMINSCGWAPNYPPKRHLPVVEVTLCQFTVYINLVRIMAAGLWYRVYSLHISLASLLPS